MHWIDEATVESTWQDVAGFGVEQAQQEMMRLGEVQPELLAYVMGSCGDLCEEARELAVYMFFVVYRIFETAYDQQLPRISTEQILEQDQETDQLMTNLMEADEGTLAFTAIKETSRQPWVTQYVVESLVEAPEGDDPVYLSEEEFGQIFLVLKTVVDLLDRNTDE